MSVDQVEQVAEDGSVKDMVRDLATRVAELEAENEALKDRVDELESQPRLEWDGEDPTDIRIYNPEQGYPYPIGSAAAQNLPSGYGESDLDRMENDIEKLKRGEVSGADLVGGAEPEIPIEADVAKASNESLKDDLSANELRAVKIFRKFGGRAESWSGTLKLTSAQVKNILEETETDPNPNTVKRAMKMLAKKTSDAPEQDRDAYDKATNLLWVAKGEKRLQLRAERSEWLEYMQDVEARYDSP